VRAGRREGPWGGGGTQEACTEMARLKAWGPRARAERTPNMVFMSVTLEVSKLSGWLKAVAACRVEGRAFDAGGEVRAGRREGLWCGGGTQAACTEMARLKAWGPRARAERTPNMKLMSVTLEVSQLSGWLKAVAACRVEGRACDAGGERCEPGGGRACGVVAAHKRHARGWPDSRLGGQGHARSARGTWYSCP
jgi:hypothetical protein